MKTQKEIQKDKARNLLKLGVNIYDLDKIEIRGELSCGEGVEIGTNVIIEGQVSLGNLVRIESNVVINNSKIESNTHVKPFSMINNSIIGKDCMIGPYGRVRSGCQVGDKSQIGNFVEIKNSRIGTGCRINHMAFVGDATLGDEVTIGAGTITCNHDGTGINETVIESGAYIGSNVNLVAPIKVSANATIGSGSTITENAPQGELTVARAKQTTVKNWKGPKSKRQP